MKIGERTLSKASPTQRGASGKLPEQLDDGLCVEGGHDTPRFDRNNAQRGRLAPTGASWLTKSRNAIRGSEPCYGNRADDDEQATGLDLAMHGEEAYIQGGGFDTVQASAHAVSAPSMPANVALAK